MKQKFLLILMIGFLTKIYSQDQKVIFELSAGPTLSVPKTSDLSNTNVDGSPEIKSSINLGAFILPSLHYKLSEKSSLDFGIGFFLDRFAIEEKISVVTNKGNRNISQIQTPINFNFHLSQDKPYQFGIGGFASFLLSAKEKGDTTIDLSQIDIFDPSDPDFIPNMSFNNDIKDDYNSISFGAFIQLKKTISFSSDKQGFILLRINQYFNSIKNNDSDLNQLLELQNEKEPTTLNLGMEIIL